MSEHDHPMTTEHSQEDPPILEWILGSIGLLLVIFLVSYLVYAAVTKSDGPPSIMVDVKSIEAVGDGYLVQIEASNDGGQTGADVTIVGILLQNGEPIESSTTTITYVPSHGVRTAGLYFTEDPTLYALDLRATGYELP